MSDASLGELVGRATQDLSTLLRKEVELAKLEIKQEVSVAVKGAGLLGGAGGAGLLAVVMLSCAAAFGIGVALGYWAGFLIVGVGYLLVAALLGLLGRRSLKRVGPPTRTIATVKDDVAWAKHPTTAPTRKVEQAV